MASLTIGNIGDIIAICDVLRTVVQALSESRGSAAEYQALVRELQALSQAVYSIRSLLEKHQHLKENDRLQELLKDCRNNLIREFEYIQPYRAALQSYPTVSAVKVICRKIRWLTGKVKPPICMVDRLLNRYRMSERRFVQQLHLTFWHYLPFLLLQG